MPKANIDDVLKQALALSGSGIQPKVRIALKYLVEHLADAEHEIDRLKNRVAALEKVAHAPTINAIAGSRL